MYKVTCIELKKHTVLIRYLGTKQNVKVTKWIIDSMWPVCRAIVLMRGQVSEKEKDNYQYQEPMSRSLQLPY